MKNFRILTAIVVLTVVGCDLPQSSSSTVPVTQPVKGLSESSPIASNESLSAAPVDFKILDEFKDGGDEWLSVLLPATIQREEFIELAKWIFRNNKVKKIKWFTNDERYEAFRESEKNYPSPADKKVEDWGKAHYFGVSNFMNNSSWQFVAINGRANRFFPTSGGFELE